MFKTIQVKELFHIGTMKESERTSLNYEGKGLSVSLHPREWQIICRGKMNGNPFKLSNENSLFAVYEYSDFLFSTLRHFGIQNGYVTEEQKILYRYFDDECQEHFVEYFNSVEDFKEEYEGEEYETEDTLIATEKMKDSMKPVSCPQINPLEELFNLYIQEKFEEYDGVWFNRPIDVICYQAPAGLIFDHKKENWLVEQVEEHSLPDLKNIYEKRTFDINQYLL